MVLNVVQMKDGTIVLPLLYSYNVELVVSLVMKLVHVINVMTVHNLGDCVCSSGWTTVSEGVCEAP
jgi:hypothetical protein